jgi:hypothetical protein
MKVRGAFDKPVPIMARQGSPECGRRVRHERNQPLTVRPESFGSAQERLVEGLILSFLRG